MKHAHVVIPDLFLPRIEANNVCADLHLPALEKLLARSAVQQLQSHSLEAWLCEAFAVPEMAIAPVTLVADGLTPEEAYWMRADPVHLRLDNAQMILQTNVSLSMEEAQQLCEFLNQYFSESGMKFFAPHPRRWYVRLAEDPQLKTRSIYQVEGRDSRFYFPTGYAALKWHGVINEIQMSLHGHPIGQACEARGGLPVNSIWLWGGGRAAPLTQPFTQIASDSELAKAFAHVSKISYSLFSAVTEMSEKTLYIWEGASVALRRGDFYAWRQSVLSCEQVLLAPLLKALTEGELEKITIDILQENYSGRFELNRSMLWKFWKRPRPLASYALV
jgi:hypothetical protein